MLGTNDPNNGDGKLNQIEVPSYNPARNNEFAQGQLIIDQIRI
jgi:hypothetical protein